MKRSVHQMGYDISIIALFVLVLSVISMKRNKAQEVKPAAKYFVERASQIPLIK